MTTGRPNLPLIAKPLSASWDILAAGVVWVGFLVAAFLLPPPVGDKQGGGTQLFRAAQLGTILLVGLLAVPVVWRRGRAGARVWSAVALASLLAGIASYLAYDGLAEAWTVRYGQPLVVSGSVLTPDARGYHADNPGIPDSQLVMDIAGGPDAVWTPESIARRRHVLTAVYVLTLPLLAASAVAVIQAIACSTGHRVCGARRAHQEAELGDKTSISAPPDPSRNALDLVPDREGGHQKGLPSSRTRSSPMVDAPRVFLSYSHDSDAHAHRVLGLADALSRDGCSVLFDQYVFPVPPDGWTARMRQCLDPANSDFVLLVCTEGYLRRLEGREEPGAGRGVAGRAG